MTGRTRKWGIGLLAVLALLAAGIALFDWNLLKDYTERRVQAATGRKAPHIDVLTVDNGGVRYISPRIGTDIAVSVATLAVPEQGTGLVTAVAGKGRYFNTPLRFRGRGGSILRLEDESRPFPIDMAFTTDDTQASFRGTITALTKLDAADLRFSIRGKDMSSLSALIRINLPETPPFSASGRLKHEGEVWALAACGGAALLLGALALPAAILPLIETGPGRDSDCRELISQVGKRSGAKP